MKEHQTDFSFREGIYMTKYHLSAFCKRASGYVYFSIVVLLYASGSALAQENARFYHEFKSTQETAGFNFGLESKLVKMGDKFLPIVYPNLGISLWRLRFDVGFWDVRFKNDLKYTLNNGPVSITPYKYKMYTFSGKVKFLVKSLHVKKQFVNVWVGADMSGYQVNDVDPERLKPLYGPSDFIQVQRLGGKYLFNAFVTLQKPFWFRNKGFSLNVTGFVPVISRNITLSEYQYTNGEPLYHPRYGNIIEVGLWWHFNPKFRTNPLKMTVL